MIRSISVDKIIEIKNLDNGKKEIVFETNENFDKILWECMNYLIFLFYKTDQKYSCSRTKLGKLLSILAFKYARKNYRVFLEPIYRYPECGTTIAMLKAVCLRDVYFSARYEDDKKVISLDEIDWDKTTPVEEKEFDSLSSDIKKAIEDVFYNFGAYSQTQLGECLNQIVEYEGICKSDGEVNLTKIAELNIHDLNNMGSNEVIDYIFY